MEFIQNYLIDQTKQFTNQQINEQVQNEEYLQNVQTRAPLIYQTYGIIDNRNDELTIQNPLQVVASIINNKFRGDNNKNKGIWIGRRALKSLGVNIDFAFLQINHWCVMIEGLNYSLETDNGSIDGVIQIVQTQDKKYNWDFYGDLKKPLLSVQRYIDFINKSKIPYTLLNDNCQKMSVYIALYANQSVSGIFDVQPINIDQNKLNSTANGLFDTFQQEENFRINIQPKIQKQQQQYKQFEQEGFEMFPNQNYNRQYLGQTTINPVTLGQFSQNYYKTNKNMNYPVQKRIQLLDNFNKRTSTTPNFDFNTKRQNYIPFQYNEQDNVLTRGSFSNLSQQQYSDIPKLSFQNLNQTKQQQNLDQYQQIKKKIKLDTSLFEEPLYDYENNDYTTGRQQRMVYE